MLGLAIIVLGLAVLQRNTRGHLPVGLPMSQVLLGLGLVLGNVPTALHLKQRVLVVALPLLGLILALTAGILMVRSATSIF